MFLSDWGLPIMRCHSTPVDFRQFFLVDDAGADASRPRARHEQFRERVGEYDSMLMLHEERCLIVYEQYLVTPILLTCGAILAGFVRTWMYRAKRYWHR